MMRISWPKLVFAVAIPILITATALAQSSGVSVGEAGVGSEILGPQPMDNGPTLNIELAGAEMVLLRGSIATADAQLGISSDGAWTLTVEDANGFEGKMRKGSWSGTPPVWSYDANPSLTNKFAILVDTEDNRQRGFDTLTDVYDISTSVQIAAESTPGSMTLDLEYSQDVDSEDVDGLYRIDLTYTLSSA